VPVAITPLGALLTSGQSFPHVAPFAGSAASRYFPETHHSLSGRFLHYWLSHDGAVLFGPPISEPFSTTNGDGTGRRYLVQYFRNARMEYHPELKNPKFEVSLGALGREYLERQVSCAESYASCSRKVARRSVAAITGRIVSLNCSMRSARSRTVSVTRPISCVKP